MQDWAEMGEELFARLTILVGKYLFKDDTRTKSLSSGPVLNFWLVKCNMTGQQLVKNEYEHYQLHFYDLHRSFIKNTIEIFSNFRLNISCKTLYMNFLVFLKSVKILKINLGII